MSVHGASIPRAEQSRLLDSECTARVHAESTKSDLEYNHAEAWPAKVTHLQEWALPLGAQVHLTEDAQQLQAVQATLSAAANGGGLCGVDAEWPPRLPSSTAGDHKKSAATLIQLAFAWSDRMEVFLLDLLSLPSASVAETMGAVLAHPNLLKVGHGIKGDVRAISMSIKAGLQAAKDAANDGNPSIACEITQGFQTTVMADHLVRACALLALFSSQLYLQSHCGISSALWPCG